MSNVASLTKYEEKQHGPIAHRGERDFTESEVDLIKTQIARGCTDGELKLFLHVCKSRGLDPFARQIYAIRRKSWNADTRTEEWRMTIQTAIDGFRVVAKRCGNEAIDDPEFTYDATAKNNSNPLGLVKSTVRVWPKGATRPTVASAYWDEYRQSTRDGKLTGKWADMPRTMIAKCAEALALRRAYPEDLSGLYVAEEMDQADVPTLPAQAVAATPIDVPDQESAVVAALTEQVTNAPDVKTLRIVGAAIANSKVSEAASRGLRAVYAKRRNHLAKHAKDDAAPAKEETAPVQTDIIDASFDEQDYRADERPEFE